MNSAYAPFYGQLDNYLAPQDAQDSQYFPQPSIWLSGYWPQAGTVPLQLAPTAPMATALVPMLSGRDLRVLPSVHIPTVAGPANMPAAVPPTMVPMPLYAPHVAHADFADTPAEPEYDVSVMAQFLGRTCQEAIHGRQWASHHISTQLSMFLQPLLTMTRLSRTTIMQSLVLLAQRFMPLSAVLSIDSLKNHVLVALVLANKATDDNTFTNASWAEASGISAAQITLLEIEWLDSVGWNLNCGSSSLSEWERFDRLWQWFTPATPAMSPIASQPPSVFGFGPHLSPVLPLPSVQSGLYSGLSVVAC